MGVVLYKAGDTHNVRGIECMMEVFNESSFLHNLELGWFYSPEECYAEAEEDKEETEEDDSEANKEEVHEEVLNIDDLTDEEVKYLAQDAKIVRWHVKAIRTLKKEMIEMLADKCHKCGGALSEECIEQAATGLKFCSDDCVFEHLESK